MFRLRTVANKQQILEGAAYVYNFDRQIYFNRKDKKVFSIEFIEDNSEADLERYIREPNGNKGWKYYFNSQPSEAVRRELEDVLA